jgi:NAD-dependent dihydropyrimidine dehydrogenase PreA subunit
VLDYARCTSCGQCFEFCLFGVYTKTSEGKVLVAHPESCKNNCPACARICPEAAIIFPKVGESPINGAEVTDDEALKANIQVNVDEILGDDVYAALNARKQKRRSLLNQKKLEKALAERKKCSEKNA